MGYFTVTEQNICFKRWKDTALHLTVNSTRTTNLDLFFVQLESELQNMNDWINGTVTGFSFLHIYLMLLIHNFWESMQGNTKEWLGFQGKK